MCVSDGDSRGLALKRGLGGLNWRAWGQRSGPPSPAKVRTLVTDSTVTLSNLAKISSKVGAVPEALI